MFTDYILKNYKPKRLIIYSRDELKQSQMAVNTQKNINMRYFIGDEQASTAMKGQ